VFKFFQCRLNERLGVAGKNDVINIFDQYDDFIVSGAFDKHALVMHELGKPLFLNCRDKKLVP